MLSFDAFIPLYRGDAKTQKINAPLPLCHKFRAALIIHFLLLLLQIPHMLIGQNSDEKGSADAFQRGEFLKYRLFYDSWMTYWMTAGYGTMEIDREWAMVDGHKTYHITVLGNSVGIFNLFFKVRDRFETYLDEDELIPRKFIRRTHEGSYKRNDDVAFDHVNLKAYSTREVKDITPGVQDIVSSFYHMRTWNFDTAEVNDEYFMDFFLDDSLYRSKIVFLGREVVRTEFGDIPCIKFKPQVAMGEVFQEPYPMEIWVSDDRNKIPILAKSAVYIGSVKMELVEFKGLKWDLGVEGRQGR
jgi:hypothetical protein